MKFGGTSVGTPQRMKEVTQLVTKSGDPVFVVLSAMSGTTNSLVEISDYLYKKNPDGANEVINKLEQKYLRHVEELYQTDEVKEQTRQFLLDQHGGELHERTGHKRSAAECPRLYAHRQECRARSRLHQGEAHCPVGEERGPAGLSDTRIHLPERLWRSRQPAARRQRLHGLARGCSHRCRGNTDLDRHRRHAQQ